MVQVSLAEYKSRQKLKPRSREPGRCAPSSPVAKTQVPVSVLNLVNSPPPASVRQSARSGLLLDIFPVCFTQSVHM